MIGDTIVLGERTCDTIAKRNLSTTYDETGIIMKQANMRVKVYRFGRIESLRCFFSGRSACSCCLQHQHFNFL